MGYSIKFFIGPLFYPDDKRRPHSSNSTTKDRTKTRGLSKTQNASYFDPLSVTLGSKTNDALEAIFDILMDQYVFSWYRTLTDDPGFALQVKLYLQYLSAQLIDRMKSLEITISSLDVVLNTILGHCQEFISAASSDGGIEPVLEDSVLRICDSHVHVCMASRSSELCYLRALVNRILPHVSFPPGLVSPGGASVEKLFQATSFKQAFRTPKRRTSQVVNESTSMRLVRIPRSSSTQNILNRYGQRIPLGTNRAAYSFFVEILSTCVLLPAMDAIANPDLLNKLILFCLLPAEDPVEVTPTTVAEVPVLHSYVQEWKDWISKKPRTTLQLDRLLRDQEQFHPFMQYMKSIKSTVPLIAVFLFGNINRRVLYDPLPPDICREIRSQLLHLLSLVRDSVNTGFHRPELTLDDESLEFRRQDDHTNPRLFELPVEFEDLLTEFLAKPTDPDSLYHLIHTRVWKDAHRIAVEQMNCYFLPMYVESPEYMAHLFGTSSNFGTSDRSRTPSLSRRKSQAIPSRIENPLKSMFTSNPVEGRCLQNVGPDECRPPVRLANRSTKANPPGSNLRWDTPMGSSQGLSSLVDGQHQLHSQLLHQSNQIDLSGWRVYIPGLSRPEIQTGRRLIDQITQGITLSGGSPIRGLQYSARPHDATFSAKITDELQNLQNSTNPNLVPQLSQQYFFTIRTERVVRGIRQPVARVNRKYSEFYVLEQKLVEFHGSAITHSLPPRKFSPRTFEFLEGKRECFEEYLQYLIAQPFLRTSELLHGFLTSKMPFSSNLLNELNLGRFVKSVPLKLIKERGQYLDQFLVSFYVSCNPQPIVMEPSEPSVEPVFTIFPSSGIGTLGGIDSLASSDHYSFNKPVTDLSSASRNTSLAHKVPSTTSLARASSTQNQPANNTSSYGMSRKHKRTWLDNRLRTKMFWNNAGFSLERRCDLYVKPCEFRGIQTTGLTDLAIYIFKSVLPNVGTELPRNSHVFDMKEEDQGSGTPADEVTHSTVPESPPPAEPWDIGNTSWNEALLSAPTVAPVTQKSANDSVQCSSTALLNCTEEIDLPAFQRNDVDSQRNSVSVSWHDLLSALFTCWEIFRRQLSMRLRFFLLWILYVLRNHFKAPIDSWLIGQISRYLRFTLNDEMISGALQTLKETLFYPSNPTTDSERSERKIAARTALQQSLTRIGLTLIIDPKLLEERLDQLFFCLQHPKWNKQLSYVLLDQLVTALFPELTEETGDSQSES